MAVVCWAEIEAVSIPRTTVCLALTLLLAIPVGGAASGESSESASARAERELSRGDLAGAAASWGDVARLCETSGDHAMRWNALIQRGAALDAIGNTSDALEALREALQVAERSGDMGRTAAARGALGQALLGAGESDEARRELSSALEIAKQTGAQGVRAAVLNNIGNLYAARSEFERAFAAFGESSAVAAETGDGALALPALGNRAWLAAREASPEQAQEWLAVAHSQAEQLSPSHSDARLWIQLGRAAALVSRRDPAIRPKMLRQAHADLSHAVTLATDAEDAGSASWALGHLGELYEEQRRTEEALELTRRALRLAARVSSREALLLWHMQAGRLEHSLRRPDAAISEYQSAAALLAESRFALASGVEAGDVQFRERVSRVHIDLVDLLLQRAAGASDAMLRQRDLERAQLTLEQFKAAELRNYFRDECVAELEASARPVTEISPRVAVVYPVVLPDRLELLVGLPTGLEQFAVPVAQATLEDTVRGFGRNLGLRASRLYLRGSWTLYDWLVAPYHDALVAHDIDTLVFVPGGVLRTIPLAALHDREKFLIEKYAVAVTPGLRLTAPKPLDPRQATFLLGGVTEVPGWEPLPFVGQELAALQKLYGGKVLLDEDFRTERLERELERSEPAVIHLATHAVFTGDPDTSYLVTHDGKLGIDRLSEVVGTLRFRDQPLELLTLSACQTAVGNERAALGLAGVAIRAGARSALGSLWTISDEATQELIVEFYTQLSDPTASKAQALQRAQRKLLAHPKYAHPYYWSPFLLISNWL